MKDDMRNPIWKALCLITIAFICIGSTVIMRLDGEEVARWEEADGKDEVVYRDEYFATPSGADTSAVRQSPAEVIKKQVKASSLQQYKGIWLNEFAQAAYLGDELLNGLEMGLDEENIHVQTQAILYQYNFTGPSFAEVAPPDELKTLHQKALRNYKSIKEAAKLIQSGNQKSGRAKLESSLKTYHNDLEPVYRKLN